MANTRLAGLGLCLASALTANIAAAATWPANIVGRYTGSANTSPIVLDITSQASGAPCVTIGGAILDEQSGASAPVLGYYCPKTGAMAFARNDPSNGQTFQVYRGAFAVSQKGQTYKLGGTFGEYDQFPNLGDYPFAVSN